MGPNLRGPSGPEVVNLSAYAWARERVWGSVDSPMSGWRLDFENLAEPVALRLV